jgi:acyl carrier protein
MENTETLTLEQKVSQLLRDGLSIDVPSAETDLIAMGALDSLALVELLLKIEENMGVAIAVDEIDLNDLRSVRSIATLVSRRLAPR